jgi:hypothetical protein
VALHDCQQRLQQLCAPERRRHAAHARYGSRAARPTLDDPEAEASAGGCARYRRGDPQLPLKQRLAFTMRKLQELDYEVIGQSLDCSEEAARAHVFQALRKIRTTLNGHALRPARSKP